MNKTIAMLALVSFLGFGVVASNSYASGPAGRSGFRMFDSYNLVGAPVKDSHGKTTGFIDEVMIDSGGHALAVIYHADYDPFEYGGGVNIPVPLQELRISKAKGGQEAVAVKTDSKPLDFAPYLDPLKMESRQYQAKIYEYYGIQPYWTQSGTARESTLTELDSRDLVGAAVENACGKVVGVINRVMVDSVGNAFAVVNHGDYDLYGEGGVNTPVPIQEIQISRTKEGQIVASLKTDMEHLDFAPYISPLQAKSRQYESNIFAFYGIQPRWTQDGGSSASR